MGFLDLFKKKTLNKSQRWEELGGYFATFSRFGSDIYASEIVRSCIRPISEHTSKAVVRSSVPEYARILNISPNLYMNGKDFLAKCRTMLEINNTVFIALMKDDRGRLTGAYPVPYQSFEALEVNKRLYISFKFANRKELVMPWDDLAVIRKDYNKYDIAGDDNTSILKMLDIINITNQGVSNAVKATANLRGILKSTKAMLSDEDIKKQKERFVRDYLNLENEGGIASLDSTQDFTPISMNPTVASWEQQKEFRENIYRYFGISDAIVMSNYAEYQMEAFYASRIEPFLVALSTELTRKIFTARELGFNNFIQYESNRLQYASISTKLSLVQLVDRGAFTPNEWRNAFGLDPIDGGDVPVRMLNTEEVEQEKNESNNDEEPTEESEVNEDGSEE